MVLVRGKVVRVVRVSPILPNSILKWGSKVSIKTDKKWAMKNTKYLPYQISARHKFDCGHYSIKMTNIAGLSFDFGFSFSSFLWLQQHLSKGIPSSQHSAMEPVLICKKKLLKGNTPFAAQFGMFFTSFNSGPNNLRCTWSNHFVLELPKTFAVHAQYASC